MKRPKNISISRRLTYSLVLTVVVASTCIIGFNYFNSSHKAKVEMERNAQESIIYLTNILEMPLWNVNTTSIKQIGRAFSQNNLIVQLKIVDVSGKVLLHIEKDIQAPFIKRTGKIAHDGIVLGRAEISLTSRYYEESNRQLLRLSILSTVIIVITLIILTGFFLRTFLEKPLHLLGEIADSYAAGSYTALDDQVPVKEFKPFLTLLANMGETINAQMTALRTSENRLQSILDNTTSVVYTKDLHGRYILINRQFESIFKITRGQIEGKTDFDIFPREMAEAFQANDKKVIRVGIPLEFDEVVAGEDGRHTYLSVKFPLFDDTGVPYAVCGISTDITEREQARETIKQYSENLEQEVKERTKELQEKTTSLEKSKKTLAGLLEDVYETKTELEAANKKLKELDQLKSMFMASMSHELRTPLNSIIGFTGILLNELAGPLNTEQKKQLKMVKGSGRHLLNLITDVLDISKIEAGRLEISCETFSLPEVIRQVAAELMPMVEKKGLSFKVDIAAEVDTVDSDKRRVRQVLINLVNNAIKFTEKGVITISCCVRGNSIETRVVDTGIGIRQDDVGKLFQAFQQLDGGLSRKYEGTGLGLNVCKGIIDLLGGSIWVESEYGKGSIFIFCLPLKKPEGGHEPQA